MLKSSNPKKIGSLLAAAILLILLAQWAGWFNKADKGDILIGLAWPVATKNSMLKEGVALAVDEINGRGGINGRKVRLVEKDDEGTVTGGVTAAQSLTRIPNLVAVIGHRASFVSIAASAIYEEAGIVMLSPASTAPGLTQKGYRLVFRNIPSDAEIARQLALFAAAQGHRRTAIYYSEDSYGLGLANAFEDHAKNAGIKIVDRISYYAGREDLERIAKKWSALDYDSIFVAHYMPDGAIFIADAVGAGISVPFLAGDAMDTPQLYEVAGTAAEGTVVGSIFNPGDPRPETKDFIEKFSKKYNTAPTPYAAQGYDAVWLLAAAMEESGSTDPQAIAATLRTFKEKPGAAGSHTFTDNGDEVGDLVVKKIIRSGEFQFID
ncbi:MAG: ABC transporter substrate-binding protein [Desulfotomaculaceae bacterium]|nr:ABC transporter substrate-binding protein [Desulfotomaculaceae bacterium]